MALNSDIQTLNKVTELQKKTVTDNYNAAIDKVKKQYAEQENIINTQKYINERQIAEQMDNLGLNDSGLNRTQQTAVQLSASNNQNKAARQMQEAVDALILEANSKRTDLETQRLQNEQSIRNSYEQAAAQAAASARSYSRGSSSRGSSGGSRATTQKVESPLLYSYVRKSGDNYVFRDNNGKEVKVAKGINPYTLTNNTALGNGNKKWDAVKSAGGSDSQKGVAIYGSFSNGYQPKGVVSGGKHYGTVSSVGTATVFGHNQNVWMTKGSTGVRYWVWDGSSNEYIQIDKNAFDTNGAIITA